jgi:hypothetical protein
MNEENKPTNNKLKSMVRQGNTVKFSRYFDGNLWYVVDYYDGHGNPHDWSGGMPARFTFEFPVPIADVGTATFLAEDKAILFMRYIRTHLEMLEDASQEQCTYCNRPVTKCNGHMDGHNA